MKYPKDTIIRWVYGPFAGEPMSRKAAKKAFRAIGFGGKRAGRLASKAAPPPEAK